MKTTTLFTETFESARAYCSNGIQYCYIIDIGLYTRRTTPFLERSRTNAPRNPLKKNLVGLSNDDVRKENVNSFLKTRKFKGVINISIITHDNIIIHSVCVCVFGVTKKPERQNNMVCDNEQITSVLSFAMAQKRFTEKTFQYFAPITSALACLNDINTVIQITIL